MPVKKQLVPIQLGTGINTKTDPKQLQAGELLQLQNGQFNSTGQINKRYGYNLLNNNILGVGTLSEGVQLVSYQDQLVAFDGEYIYSYSPAIDSWIEKGIAISVTSTDENIIHNTSSTQLNPDMASALGIEVYAWEDARNGTQSIRYAIKDTASGAFIVSDTFLDYGQQPKCITFNSNIFIFYTDGGNNIYYKYLAALDPSLISNSINIINDGFSGVNGFPYDVSVINNNIYIAYLSGSVITGAIKALYIDINLNISHSIIVNSTAGQCINNGVHGAINVVGDSSSNIWITWANGIDIRVQVYKFQFLSLILYNTVIEDVNAVVISAIEYIYSDVLLIVYEVYNSEPYLEQIHATTITTTGSIGGGHLINSVGLASKCFKYNGNIYINSAYQSSGYQSTDFLLLIANSTGLLQNPVVIAKFTPGISGGLQTKGMCPETVNISTGQFKFANLSAGSIISEANTIFTTYGVTSSSIVFTPSDNYECVIQDDTLLITGGILQCYDGSSVNELGFHLYPENITATASGSGSGLSTGSYQYIVEYQWADNNNLLYRSSPSVAVSVSVTAGQSVIISGTNLQLTQKPTDISVVIYRTAANGTTFNRITSVISPLLNLTGTNTWTFTDTASDTTISFNEADYTTGGVLANIAPPANSLAVTYNNRVFLSGMSDPLLMWYSQSVVNNSNANTIPPQFCAELNISLDPRGGAITALSVVNQILIIFKETAIFSLQGNGPDATGNNSDYGDPSFITSDVGCINASSVVITPNGLMFQSAKGIYLLDQSLNLTYIGDKVEAYNSYTITSATLHSNYNQIIFTTAQNISLVYDYYQKQWSTWTNQPAIAATIYNNTFTYLTNNGLIYVQNPSIFTDASSPIYLSLTTPNLSFAGIQGYQRVFRFYILGTFKGPHLLQVNVAYDYNDTYSSSTIITPENNTSFYDTWGSSISWGDDQYWGGNGYEIYEFKVDLQIQKCSAIRIQISDTQSGTYNEGYAISSIVFEVGALPGGNRLPSNNVIGIT